MKDHSESAATSNTQNKILHSKSAADISATSNTQNKIAESVAEDQADKTLTESLKETGFSSSTENEENVPTVSTLSEHSRKVVEAVEFLESENKELKIKVKQLENNAEKNAYLLRELKDAVDALRK
eukprot:scaffold359815_cov162-Cyclotella_meneghiniana.AAC.1